MLQVENLVVKYGNIAAVKGISLDVAEGEIISVVGANGAGKSTTVNTIAGIVKMTSGKIIYNGIDISKTTPQERVKQGIILAPEGRQMFNEMSVKENLLMGAYLQDSASANQMFDTIFDLFPILKSRLKQPAGTLSGGEQQMLKVRYQEIQEYKELFGDEFYDYNLVFCNANGRPLEHQIITRSLQKLIRENDLPPVVFHSLRHSSITYKLKLNGGDIKSVQGDSGHAQVKMVTDVYSHILDEDRRLNAQRFEETFYQQKNPSAVSGATVEPTPATPPVQEPQAITEEAMLNYMVQNPEFLQKFKVLLGVGN